MNILQIYKELLQISKNYFNDVVSSGTVLFTESQEPHKLRLKIVDGSIVDIFYSKIGKYSYHWERSLIDGTIFRHDNAPHKSWRKIKTYPKHFHFSSQNNVIESEINNDPLLAIKEFLSFIKETLALK